MKTTYPYTIRVFNHLNQWTETAMAQTAAATIRIVNNRIRTYPPPARIEIEYDPDREIETDEETKP
jgi:hypothetical protein